MHDATKYDYEAQKSRAVAAHKFLRTAINELVQGLEYDLRYGATDGEEWSGVFDKAKELQHALDAHIDAIDVCIEAQKR